MKSKELRELTIDELTSKNEQMLKELFNIKFQLHTGRLESIVKLSALRKDIVRLKTILREKRG